MRSAESHLSRVADATMVPWGSGKTTVGRCILGLTDISGGRISFSGTDLLATRKKNPGSLRCQIQIVFQEPADALDPRMRIGSCIAEPLVALGVPAAERQQRVAEALDLVGLARRRCSSTQRNSAAVSSSVSASPAPSRCRWTANGGGRSMVACRPSPFLRLQSLARPRRHPRPGDAGL
jgi:hypothetical protein